MTGQGSLVLTLDQMRASPRSSVGPGCKLWHSPTRHLSTSERLGRGALTPHTEGPEMQIKAGDSPIYYPGTTLAATPVERHHRARHKLRAVPGQHTVPPYQNR